MKGNARRVTSRRHSFPLPAGNESVGCLIPVRVALTLLSLCPRCRLSGDVHKSRFRGLEVVLPLLLLRPVRCYNCGCRYYRPWFCRTQPRGAPSPFLPDSQKPGADRAA